MKRSWIIGLISTDYDLKNEREKVRSFIKSSNMSVSAFEEPDFPVTANVHSHDNCLNALSRSDIIVVLIKNRYGGRYFFDQSVSITEEEYSRINVPKIVLIHKETWHETHIYRRQLKVSGLSEDDFISSNRYQPTSVESVKVLQFVERIQDDYQLTGRSNWIVTWSNLQDLETKLPLLLQSQSLTILQRIREGQRKEVRSKKTSTALSVSLGDVFDKKYYMEQDYEERSGCLSGSGPVSDKINETLIEGASCCILGDAGAGKTTLLAKCFLEMDSRSETNYFKIPMYVWLKELGKDFSFSMSDYLTVCCEKYLNKSCYPFFKTEDFNFIFYLDGFDELSEKISESELHRLLKSELFQWPLLLTSRVQYAERYITSTEFGSKFLNFIQLEDWTEATAQAYIERFCQIRGKKDDLKKRISILLLSNPDLHDLLKKPLLVTILLYVIEHNRMQIPETITSRADLFEKCFEYLAIRELETKLSNNQDSVEYKDIIFHWAFFAWSIYEAKLNGGNRIRIDSGLARVGECIDRRNLPTQIYDVIFDTADDFAYGAFHEQFLEYLVASALAFACENKSVPYPEFLRYVMRPEINRYFRTIVYQKPIDQKKQIIENIKALYFQCAGDTSNESVAKRIHAVYHLTRFEFDGREQFVNRLFNIEQNKAVRQSLFFGAIKAGDMNREREFYNLLLTDKDYSNANRGYHLAYYDEFEKQRELPYNDDGIANWSGSLRAFRSHFSRKNIEHNRLLRIDLLTMRQFMEKRSSVGPLTDEILTEFEESISNITDLSQEYLALLNEEYAQFKSVYEKFKN